MFKITKTVKKGDYLYGVCKEHPKASKYGYVLMHRLVMENHLGRILEPDEVVHHINNNKHDNRIENLEVMTNSQHAAHHNPEGRTLLKFDCDNCGKELLKERRQVKYGSVYCNRECYYEKLRRK